MSPEKSNPMRVSLRAVEPSDVDRLYLWENDPSVWPFGAPRGPYSRHQLWEYANGYDADPYRAGQLRLIVEIGEEDGQRTPCGTVDLYDIDARDSRAFIGIMIAPGFRRKGIASAALVELESYCRDILGLRLLASETASDNLPSIRLFTGRGFILTGRRPSWIRRCDEFISAVQFQKQLYPTAEKP